MSASRERKKRVELEAKQINVPQAPAKKKISEGLIFAIVMLLAIACFIGFVVGRGIWARNQVVLTVGEHEVTVKEFNYFYNSIANQYLTYASYLGSSYGIDATTPLDKTEVTSDHTTFLSLLSMYGYLTLDTSYLTDAAGSYVTMAHLIADNAKTQAISCYVTYDEAVKNGFELDADHAEEIEAELAEMKTYGKENYGWSLNKTIRNTYGSGCNKNSYYDYMVLTHTASHYSEELSYTDEEITARYNESPEQFDVAAFYYYSVSASNFVEADEEGNTPEPTEAEEELAKTAAAEMEQNFVLDDEEKTVSLVADYTYDYVKSLCGEEAAEWVFADSTTANAVKSFDNEGTYYVIKFLNRDDYALTDVVQIYVPADSEDAELAEGEKSAAVKIADIEAALQSDASVENFKAIAEQYTEEGADIEVTGLSRSSLSGVSKESCVWAMDASRKVGDYAKFEVSGGTIFVMITGYGENYIHTVVDQTMASEWLEAAVLAAEAVCGYDEKAALRGNVGLAMSSAG